jgi:hypothetical protein
MSTSTPKNLGDLGSGNEIERVRRVSVETPKNKPWTIMMIQEKFVDDNGSVIHKSNSKPIRRKYDAVKTEQFTFDGVTATVEQIAGLITAAADAWRVEDAS